MDRVTGYYWKIAKEKGLKKLEAEYYEWNKPAEMLYIKRLKYLVEGRKKFSGRLKDGIYVDKILIGNVINKDLKEYS